MKPSEINPKNIYGRTAAIRIMTVITLLFLILPVLSGQTADFSASSLTVCEGGAIVFTDASTGTTGSVSYAWDFGNGASPSDAVSSGPHTVIYSQPGTVTVTLTITDEAGTSTETKDNYITVNALPSAPVISADGPLTFCEGGSVTLTSSAAAGYLWSTGATTQSIIVTESGDYSLTVTDANGCTSPESAVITVTVNPTPATPVISASGPLTFCDGGSVTLTSTAATDYLWSTGATTQSIIVTESGDYSLAVTDGNGCTSAESAVTTVTVNPTPATPVISASGPTTFCEGGSVTLTSTAASSYLWSTGATTQSIIVTQSGDYSLTVTDGNGCTSAESAVTTVTVNPTPATSVISASGPLTFCEGGSVTLTSTAATDYLWSTGATTQSIIVTQSGDYSLTVTDGNGCTSAESAVTTVTVNSLPVPAASSNTPVCEGDQLQLTGGPDGMSLYSWSGPDGFTSSLQNPVIASATLASAGEYTLTVTNSNGCEAAASTIVAVTQQPVAEAGTGGDECDLNFVLGATPSVGTGTWTMTSGTGTANFSSPNSPTATVTVSDYGTKVFTWTEVNGTCSDADQVTVNFYQQPVAEAGNGGDECDLNFVLSATPSVGTGNWTMTSGTGTANFSNPNSPAATVAVSDYGTKVFTWTEVNGTCSDADQVTVNFYQQPVAEAGTGGDECDLNFVLGATPSFGTGTWTMTSGTGTANFSSPNSPAATVTVSDYGTKLFTWTEVNGTCSDADQVTVNFYQQPVAEAGTGGDECDLNFVLGAAPSVGTGTWTMTSGTGTANFSSPNSPAATVTVSDYGTKVFTWTEVNGSCSDADQVTVNFYPLPTADAGAAMPAICQTGTTAPLGGSVGGSATGGIWSDGGIGGTFNPAATDPNATWTPPAAYYGTATLTLTTTGGLCGTDTDSKQVTVNPNAVIDLTSGVATAEQTVCILSPLTDITYQVSGGGTGAGVTGLPSGVTGTFSGGIFTISGTPTVSGVFNYTVTTTGTCAQTTAEGTITVIALPVVTASDNSPVCFGTQLTLSGGPSGMSSYSWTGPNGFNSSQQNVTVSSSATLAMGGVYTLTAVNSYGCVNSATTNVTVNPLPEPAASSNSPVCEGDQLQLTGAPAGMSSYLWSGPDGFTSTLQSPVVSASATLSMAGEYTLLVTNSNGCQNSSSEVAEINPLPEAEISGTTSVCKDAPFPVITFTGSGGTPPYTFTYTVNGGTNQFITASVGNSTTLLVPTGNAGTYVYELVSVMDGSETGCSQEQSGSATITINPLPTAVIDGTTAVCQFEPYPAVTFTGSGGTAPYTFVYTINSIGPYLVTSTGSTATVAVPTEESGSFTYSLVSVSDASSTACSQAAGGSATVTVNALPEATISGSRDVCQGSPSPFITFTGSAGRAPYTFTYRVNNGGNQTITTTSGSTVSLAVPTAEAGEYVYELLSVRDGSSTTCEQPQTGSATILVNPLPQATITGTTTVCRYDEAPLITFTGSGGEPPYTFAYSLNSGSQQLITTSSGNSVSIPVATEAPGTFTYTLFSVRDASSTACSQSASGSATVTVNTLPTATISGSTAVCQNAASPEILFTGASGSSPYTFTYRVNGGTVQTVTTASGNNMVTVPVSTTLPGIFIYELLGVSDGSESVCDQSQGGTATVRVNPLPQATIAGTTEICRNDASPVVTFTGTGGTAPYTFTYNVNGGGEETVVSTGSTATVSVPATSAGIFTYNLLSVQDASSTSCERSVTGAAVITINELPSTGAITGNANPPCEATGVIYSVALSPGSTYTWLVPDGASVVSGATGPENNTITVDFSTNNGNIGVIETNASGCSGALVILPVTLQGCDLNPNFTVSSTAVCSGSSVVFTNLSSGTTGSTTYSWNFGAGASPATITGAGPHTVTYSGSGTSTVSLTITDGATETETKNDYITINPLPSATIGGSTAVCEDATSPQILFTGSLGTRPYTFTYTINGGTPRTVQTVSGSSVGVPVSTATPGTFVYELVSVRDGSSTACEQPVTGSATVTVNPLPQAEISGTTTVCQFDEQPQVTFTGSGGTVPYTFTYTLNGGAVQTLTTQGGSSSASLTINSSLTGSYRYELVGVRDGSTTACWQSAEGTATVRVDPLPTASISGSATVCRNSASPGILFTGSGGTPPYTFTYTVNNGTPQYITTIVGSTISVPVSTDTPGTYVYELLAVMDASDAACEQTEEGEATVTVLPLPTATITGDAEVCKDGVSPLVTFTGSGGTAPYTFTYTVNGSNYQTVTTTSGNSVTISVPTGTIGSFNYELVSVRDGGTTSCNNVQGGSALITVNPLPSATITGTTSVCQYSAEPMITFTGSGGTPPYTFTYTVNSGEEVSVVSTGNVATVPVSTDNPGIYTYILLSVTDASSTMCEREYSGSATVRVNPLPEATISGTTAVCKDDLPPEITFTGFYGTLPYTFTYSINGGNPQTITTSGGSSVRVPVSTVTAGVYEYELISVRDGSTTNCVNNQSGSAIITVNPLPQATITGTASVCRNSSSPLITFTGSNGTSPYTFTYSINSEDPQTVTTAAGSNSVTVAAPTGTVGTFTYVLSGVSDGSSTACERSVSGNATITVLPLPQASIGGTTAVCRNAPSPNVTFTGSSGTAPYTFVYTINGGAFRTVTAWSGNSVTVAAPTGTAGVFEYELVSVSDGSSQSCSQPQGGSAVITVNPLPVATIAGNAVVCNFDSEPVVTFTGSEGTAPYTFTYTVNGGGNQTVISTGNIAQVPVSTDLTGTFRFDLVSVRDASNTGCSQPATGSATITVNTLPAATIGGSTVVCQAAESPEILFTGASGTSPYTFTYRINNGTPRTVTSAAGSNSVSVEVSTAVPGTFTYELLSVSDGSASVCDQSQTGTATVTVNPLPGASISGSTSVCRNGASPFVTFTGSAGTAPYTFTYSVNGGTPQTVTSTGNIATVAVPTSTTGILTYELISVEDASTTSCSRTVTGEVIVTVNELPATSAITGNATPPCEAAGIEYSVVLTPGSTYTWLVPEGATVVSGADGPENNSITVNFSANNGNVSVIETNANGCSGSMVSLPVSLQGCALNPNFTVSNTAVCSGSSVVFTNLSSGTSGSTIYNWNFGTGANPSTATGAGPHTVIYTGSGTSSVTLTITDGATETLTRANYITINPLPTATIEGTTAVCEDSSPPQVIFTGASGTLPYTFTYTINGGAERTVQTTSGSSVAVSAPTDNPGIFLYELVSVRDGSTTACEQPATGSATVTVNPLPQAAINGTTTVCRLDDSPLITFTGSGGTRPYTFSYRMNGGGIQTVTTSLASNTVTIPVSTLATGTYSYELLSVRDGSSTACEQSANGTAIITVNPLPTATISGTTTVCRNAEPPAVTFTGASGTPPYTFTYTVNSGTPRTVTTVVGSSVTVNVPTNIAGTYTYSLVSVQDRGGEGCSQNAGGNVTVTVNQLPTATLTGTTDVCEGSPAPSVTFTGANGTEPYTFTYRLNGGNFQTITAPSGNSVSITVPTGEPGIFTYDLVSVRDASTTTCSQEQEGRAVVTVNPMPTATINGTATVCRYSQGVGVTLTGYNGTPPYTFNYNINSGVTRTVTTSAGSSSVIVPVPADVTGVFTYSLMTVRDASSTACTQSVPGTATVTVLPLPTAQISGTTTVCANDSYPLVTFTGAAGSAPYTFIYNINGGGDLSVTTTDGNSVSIAVPTETPGVYRYNLVAVIDGSTNACSNTQEGSATVTVRRLPEATITGGGIVCRYDVQPPVTFTGSAGQAPYTFTYRINGGDPLTVTTTSGSSVTVPVPTTATGTFEYELLGVTDAGNPSCGQVQAGSIIYTVNPLPQATISGTTVVCRDDPEPEITFRGSNGTLPYTFTYTINGGEPLTVTTDPGQSNITITAETTFVGEYVYELVSVQDASATGCSQDQEGSIVITVDEIPVAYAGTGGEICGPEYQLGAIPDIGSGVWSMSSGTGTATFTPDATDPEAIVTVSEYGVKEFTWTEFNGVCSDDATIEVIFWEMPEAIAGPGGESCNLTFTLNATPDIGTGTWSMSAGTGSATFIPNANDPNAVVEVTEYGAKEFTWTEVNGTCTNADDLEVVFYRQPVANAGTGGNNCGRFFTLRATPSYGTGTWSVTSGPGDALFLPHASSPTATVEIDVFGTYVFTWTEVNGSCSDNDAVEVSFFEVLPANGGAGGTECDLDFMFNATPVTGNGVWSVISGPGNAIFEPGPEYPDATVVVDQFGTYEFGWTEVNVVCQSTDIVVVDFHDIPAVATINDTILCKGSTVELITSGEGSFVWSPGAFLDQTDTGSPNATPDTTIQYIVTLTDQFGCVNSDTVVVGIAEQPVADAGPDRVLDYIFDAELYAELRPGETGVWSLMQGGGTFEDATAPVTMINGLSLGVNLIEWMVTNGICPEATDILSITVNDLVIPTLITPNGDPLNEYFELRGIETLGVTELIIFDRGGTQVYRNSNYANDWNGVDQHGNQLPEDTYFYVMRPQNGTPRSGYIVIRR
jgi:gliding motility-associated-like protein